MRMLQKGDLNPRRFTKPSMMANLTAAGVALGVMRAGGHDKASSLDDLGGSPRNYYRLPTAIKVPKQLFAILSVAAMAMTGVCARILGGKPWQLVMSPLLVCLMPGYFYLSWHYINADILGAFFIAATVTHLLVESARRPEFARGVSFAALQGLLVGLTIGCKYNLFPIILPYVIHSLFCVRDRLISRWITFGTLIVVGFLISTPYALITPDELLNDAISEARHYATGHPGATKAQGWEMFTAYGEDILENCGPIALLASLAGMAIALVRDLRTGLVTFSFPIVFMVYMSEQRTYFDRNIVSIYLFVAIAICIALFEAFAWLDRLAERHAGWASRPAWQRRIALLAVLGLPLAASAPWNQVARHYSSDVESRNTVSRYLVETAPAGAKIFVDPALLFDTRRLRRRFRVAAPTDADETVFSEFRTATKGSYLVASRTRQAQIDEALLDGAQVLLQAGWRQFPEGATTGYNPALVVLRR